MKKKKKETKVLFTYCNNSSEIKNNLSFVW